MGIWRLFKPVLLRVTSQETTNVQRDLSSMLPHSSLGVRVKTTWNTGNGSWVRAYKFTQVAPSVAK